MKTVCKTDECSGCMACIDICSQNAINVEDNLKSYNAIINEELCIGCNVCCKVCHINYPVEQRTPAKWFQGWSEDSQIRSMASSGGLAPAISIHFIQEGGIIWSCVFENGMFGFQQAETINELIKFSGSKYVKSNPLGAYKAISESLKKKKKILFIGLPCQIASLKNFVGMGWEENLYTIDLICHGSPSPQILALFLNQYGHKLSEIKDIRFRKKDCLQTTTFPYSGENYKSITPAGVTDRFLISFLNCVCYTESCYKCKYANIKRISDITIGDSWGSELSDVEQNKGISLILCQTQKGIRLVEGSNLHLENVDLNKAIEKNQQLITPAIKPENREFFLKELQKGKNFNKLIKKIYPNQCHRQEIRKWLVRFRLRKKDEFRITLLIKEN